ncbi:MAG TPA: hypothetical protein VNH21_05260 [Steroidobacteraceae bacterium]|nr:hypothetical protein [Steroidobacteraceae bacterium]
MTQSDSVMFTELQERVARLEVLVDNLRERCTELAGLVHGHEESLEELLGPSPDHAAARKEKNQLYGRGTGRRVVS